MVAECKVCAALIDKERVHYGGISCLSCRQFFWRETHGEEQKICQEAGKCVVNHWEQAKCRACRYQKCLAIGMKAELVLNTESKKKRFKKVNICAVANVERVVLVVSDESSEDDFEIPPIINCQEDDFTNNESILDPETGEVIEVYQNAAHGDQAEDGPGIENYLLTQGESTIGLPSTSKGEKCKNPDIFFDYTDDPVLYYGHKKFRKIYKESEPKDDLVANESIIDIALLPQTEEEGTKLQVILKKSMGAESSKR